VVTVVLYHAGVPGITGGFVGVDVFFVISGYLITRQLRQLAPLRPLPLLREFYARRVRRILPALSIVTLATLLLGAALLLPNGERQDLARSAIASSILVSNLQFLANTKNYFAGPAELQPLLHTWSLSVEEQFYLVWPLAFIVLARLDRRSWGVRAQLAGVAVVSTFSLAACIWLTAADRPAAFFGLHTRAWELGIGCILALWTPSKLPKAVFDLGAVIGIAAIGFSIFVISPDTEFPGVAAVVPVLGAAIIVLAGENSRSSLGFRLLSKPAVVFIGKLSYPWYLWHWPLISIARILDLGERNVIRDLAIAVVSMGFAYLTTRFLETPVRQKKVWLFATDSRSLFSGAALTLLCIALATALWLTSRRAFESTVLPTYPPSRSCTEQYSNGSLIPNEKCLLNTGTRATLFVAGDSFANHWSPAVTAWAQGNKVTAIDRSLSSCPVLIAAKFGIEGASRFGSRCVEFSALVLGEISKAAAAGPPVGVILSNTWPGYLSSQDGDHSSQFEAALKQTLDSLEGMRVRVLVIGPSPQFESPVPACVARRSESDCRLARRDFDARSKRALAVISVVSGDNSRTWLPSHHLCDSEWCYPMKDGNLMLTDSGHLSRFAAESAVLDLEPYFDWLAEPRTMSP
jgi:peptidoglycan/LPS O-acetylase OafA/YrhL